MIEVLGVVTAVVTLAWGAAPAQGSASPPAPPAEPATAEQTGAGAIPAQSAATPGPAAPAAESSPPPSYPTPSHPAYGYPAYGYPAYGYAPYGYPAYGYPPGYYGPPPAPAYGLGGPQWSDDPYPVKKRGVFLSPLEALSSGLVGEVAFAVSRSASLNVRGGYRYRGAGFTAWESTTTSTVRAQSVLAGFGAQFFLFEKAFHRLYVMPEVEYSRAWATAVSADVLGVGLKIGYQWTWPGGFSMRLGSGASYYRIAREDGDVRFGATGLMPTVEFLIGWLS